MPIDQIYLDEHNILILKEYISQPAQKIVYACPTVKLRGISALFLHQTLILLVTQLTIPRLLYEEAVVKIFTILIGIPWFKSYLDIFFCSINRHVHNFMFQIFRGLAGVASE